MGQAAPRTARDALPRARGTGANGRDGRASTPEGFVLADSQGLVAIGQGSRAERSGFVTSFSGPRVSRGTERPLHHPCRRLCWSSNSRTEAKRSYSAARLEQSSSRQSSLRVVYLTS